MAVTYDVEISHRRRDPFEYRLTHRTMIWLVDLDELPTQRTSRLVAFRPQDHLDDEANVPIRTKVERLLAEHGAQAPAKVWMLGQPRVLGYAFNPLTVFYCFDADDTLTNLIAEVRNTYGGRHNYVLDAAGRPLRTDKQFYVSPFYPVDGHYTMSLPVPDAKLTVAVTLHREGERPFVATMTGTKQSDHANLRDALKSPLATRAVMFGIRRHGITLYAKGLRPYPRPSEGR